MELEKKAIEKRLQQVEQDVYKANRDKKEALAERDSATSEALRVKKQRDDLEKAMGEVVEAKNKLQSELDGKCLGLMIYVFRVEESVCSELKGNGAVCKSIQNIQGNIRRLKYTQCVA